MSRSRPRAQSGCSNGVAPNLRIVRSQNTPTYWHGRPMLPSTMPPWTFAAGPCMLGLPKKWHFFGVGQREVTGLFRPPATEPLPLSVRSERYERVRSRAVRQVQH